MKTREERRQSLMEFSRKHGESRGLYYQHMLDLDDEFPEVGMFEPQSIGAEVGPGWKDLLRPVLEVLREHGCKVGQIKQKFGGLRVYWDFPDRIEDAMAAWRHLPEEQRGHFVDRADGTGGKVFLYVTPLPFHEERERISAAVRPVVAAAEALAWATCDRCGASIDPPREESFRTICDSCEKL